MFNRLGEVVFAQICTTNEYLVQGLLMVPATRKDFMKQTVEALKKENLCSNLADFGTGIFGAKEVPDLRRQLDEKLKNNSLSEYVIKKISKNANLDMNKINAISKSKSKSKGTDSKNKSNEPKQMKKNK